MIGFDFDYYECYTIQEAVELYNTLSNKGKVVLYFSGGTEIITFADRNTIQFDAVIAINKIPELKAFALHDHILYIGAANTLSFINDTDIFPLLSESCLFVADQTSRNKITIGGVLCGQINYRNAVLPFFISDTTLIIANRHCIRNEPFLKVFNNGLNLTPGDLVVQFIVPERVLELPYYTKKIRKIGVFGYPLIGLSMVNNNGRIKAAFSAVCEDTFSSIKVDNALSDRTLSIEDRVNKAIEQIPCEIITDVQGTAPYRKFVLKQQLQDGLIKLEGDKID